MLLKGKLPAVFVLTVTKDTYYGGRNPCLYYSTNLSTVHCKYYINKTIMADGTFLMSISGQIEYVDILAAAGTSWHCKYEFVSGPDWKIVSGLEAGLSQTANVVANGEKIVLNLPLEVVYKSTIPFGWPQIVLSVYKGINLQGYGRAHIPFQPGCHKFSVCLSKPQPSSLLGYVGTIFGYQPELLQPKMLATTAGNNLIQMISNGEVQISVNLMFQGLHSLGYDMGHSTVDN